MCVLTPVKVQDAGISFPTAKALCGRVELLPKVPDWKAKKISISGYPTREQMFSLYRDSFDCVEYLLGNPLFANCMDFCPVQSYRDAEHTIRVYTEWLTGNAAWEMQVRFIYIFSDQLSSGPQSLLPDGATPSSRSLVSSTLKQVTSRAHHEIERYTICAIARKAPPSFVIALRALTDFRYLAQSRRLDNDQLAQISSFLQLFHTHKKSILDARARVGKGNKPMTHFQIPKLQIPWSMRTSRRSKYPDVLAITNPIVRRSAGGLTVPRNTETSPSPFPFMRYNSTHATPIHWSTTTTTRTTPPLTTTTKTQGTIPVVLRDSSFANLAQQHFNDVYRWSPH